MGRRHCHRASTGRIGRTDPWHLGLSAPRFGREMGCGHYLHWCRPRTGRRIRERGASAMKQWSAAEALSDVADGSTVMIGGFGTAGQPVELIDALRGSGARDLTVVNNNAGNG